MLLVACCLLLVTCYLLLVTCYLLLVTSYFLLVAGYLLLVTCYMLLVTCFLLLVLLTAEDRMVHKCRVLFMSSLYRDLTDFDVEIFKKEIKVKILFKSKIIK